MAEPLIHVKVLYLFCDQFFMRGRSHLCVLLSLLGNRQTIGKAPRGQGLSPAHPVFNLCCFLIPEATGPSAAQAPKQPIAMFPHPSALPPSNWDCGPHSLLASQQASP